MTPEVSIVIVSFRSRDVLERCIRSIERCRAAVDLECILVDNASGDGTVEWVEREHAWVRLVANAHNVGFTRGVNQGLEAARGNLLFLLNPDCEIDVAPLQSLMRAARDPRVAAAAPLLANDDGRLARSCGRFPNLWSLACDHLGLASAFPRSNLFGWYKYGGTDLEALDRVDWASGAALMIPRHAFARLGGLDERIFMYMEEVDWCRRASRVGLEVRMVRDARIVHVGQQSSRKVLGETYLHNLRSRIYYFRKHHGGAAALAVKLVLGLSLVLKWGIATLRPAARATARLYASGLGAVWVA